MAELKKINKSMTFGEVMERYPFAAEIFFKHGLHCVGCHVAFFETIEQGATAHGMDEETIDNMIKEVNNAIKKKEK